MEPNRPAGDIHLDLVARYPGEDLLHISLLERQLLVMRPRPLADLLVHKSYDFIKPPRIANFLRQILGDGLIIVEGNQHKFLRKNTMPAFGFRHIKNLYPMMWDKALLLTQALGKEVGGEGVVELSAWASRVTLDIIGIAGLGRRFNMLSKASDPLLATYDSLLEPSTEKLGFAMSCILFGRKAVSFLPWRMNGIFNGLTGNLEKLCMPMIQDKRDAIAKSADDDHFDVLSLLIKSNNFSDTELKDQLLTFLAAG